MSLKGLCSQHVLEVEKRTTTRGVAAGQIKVWAKVKTIRGFVQPRAGGEPRLAQKGGQQVTTVVYFAADPGVKPDTHRLVYVNGAGARRPLVVVGLSETCEQDRLWVADCVEREDVN